MRIRCTRPNASELINGVAFEKDPAGGVVSGEISAEEAELFLSIPGYTDADAPKQAELDVNERAASTVVANEAPKTRRKPGPKPKPKPEAESETPA